MPSQTLGLGRGMAAIAPEATDALEVLFEGMPAEDDSLEIKVAKLYLIVCDLKEQLETHRSRTEALSADEMYRRSKAFKDNNERIWKLIIAKARFAAKNGRRFSLKKEIEILRDSGYLERNENELYKFNNSYTSTLTLFLIEEVPEVEPYIARRGCKTEKFFEGRVVPRVPKRSRKA